MNQDAWHQNPSPLHKGNLWASVVLTSRPSDLFYGLLLVFCLFVCLFLIVQQIAIPWSRKGKPTPVFLPGKFHGPKSLGGEQYTGSQRVDTTEPPEHTCTHTAYIKCPLLLKDSCIKKNNNKGNTLCKWPGAVSFDINNKSLGSSLQPYEHHLALQTGQ